jgi:hypothetical protein
MCPITRQSPRLSTLDASCQDSNRSHPNQTRRGQTASPPGSILAVPLPGIVDAAWPARTAAQAARPAGSFTVDRWWGRCFFPINTCPIFQVSLFLFFFSSHLPASQSAICKDHLTITKLLTSILCIAYNHSTLLPILPVKHLVIIQNLTTKVTS